VYSTAKRREAMKSIDRARRRSRIKTTIGTLVATAALAGGVQAALPASAAAMKSDAATCDRYLNNVLFYDEIGLHMIADMYWHRWANECFAEGPGPGMEV
jgi:hypothetical protein